MGDLGAYMLLISPLGTSWHLLTPLAHIKTYLFLLISAITIIIPGDEKECLSNCIDQLMTVTLTQATYPNSHAFDKTKEFCYVLKKLIRSCNGDRRDSLIEEYPGICDNVLAVEDSVTTCPIDSKKINLTKELKKSIVNYAKENIAKVNIFLKDPFVKRYIREEKITENTFIGTIGGLLGLFLGFSFISGAEIVYLIALSIYDTMTCKKIPKSSLSVSLKPKLKKANHLYLGKRV